MQVLKSDSPTGPFVLHSDGPITPSDWDCLDGTIYFDPQGIPFLVFSHSFQQNPKGEMCAVELYQTAEGSLLMLWSSFSSKGYSVGLSRSDNGQIDGNWTHEQPFLQKMADMA